MRRFLSNLRSAALLASVLVVGGSALVLPSGATPPTGDEVPRGVQAAELPSLRETPDIPIGTLGLRHPLPDHPGSGAVKPGGCDKDVDLTSTILGVVAVAAQDNGICTRGIPRSCG